MGRVLLVDDDVHLLTMFATALTGRGHNVFTAGSAEEALASVETAKPEVIVMDFGLPVMNGLEAFITLKTSAPQIPVIIMTGQSSMSLAIEATSLGVFDFQAKPLDPKVMIEAVERAAESFRDSLRPQPNAAASYSVNENTIVGNSPTMQEVFKSIGRVARTDATVLIRGESGTGKELVAEVIHRYSQRRLKPFVAINCIAIPEPLLESELFGHERGAFTGASNQRIGKFEQAEGGTIFLDEIGDVPLGVQGKILRILQERTLTRVGSNDTIHVDVRVLAATNRNLEQAITQGKYREDLFHRLNVVSVKLPPLRERRQDIPDLVNHFVHKFASELGVDRHIIAPEALALIAEQPWPGNVRELSHFLCRLMIFNPGITLREHHVRQALTSEAQNSLDVGNPDDRLRELVRHHLFSAASDRSFQSFVERTEALLVLEALRSTNGNQSHAAKLLGMSRETFRWKLKKYTDQLTATEASAPHPMPEI